MENFPPSVYNECHSWSVLPGAGTCLQMCPVNTDSSWALLTTPAVVRIFDSILAIFFIQATPINTLKEGTLPVLKSHKAILFKTILLLSSIKYLQNKLLQLGHYSLRCIKHLESALTQSKCITHWLWVSIPLTKFLKTETSVTHYLMCNITSCFNLQTSTRHI